MSWYTVSPSCVAQVCGGHLLCMLGHRQSVLLRTGVGRSFIMHAGTPSVRPASHRCGEVIYYACWDTVSPSCVAQVCGGHLLCMLGHRQSVLRRTGMWRSFIMHAGTPSVRPASHRCGEVIYYACWDTVSPSCFAQVWGGNLLCMLGHRQSVLLRTGVGR